MVSYSPVFLFAEYLDMFNANSAPNESRIEPQKLFSEPIRIIEKYPAGEEGDLLSWHVLHKNCGLSRKLLIHQKL